MEDIQVDPHSIDAELAVLGAIIVDNQSLYQVIDRLDPEDFYVEANKIIYAACRDMINDSKPVDYVSLKERLKNRMDEIGGISYLSTLIDGHFSSGNIAHYGQIVKEHSQWRKLITAGRSITEQAYRQDTEPMDIAGFMTESSNSITDTNASTAMTAKAFGPWYCEELELKIQERHSTGILTGLTMLDHQIDGLQKKDFTLIAARTSQGKTALVTTILRNLDPKVKTIFFSLEETKQQIGNRIAAGMTGINGMAIKAGRVTSSEAKAIYTAIMEFAQKSVTIDDCATITLNKIRAACKRQKAISGLDLVIVDYIGLVTHRPKDMARMNRYEVVGEISHALKVLAKELNVAMVALAQINRHAEPFHQPELHELRESGNLEQDADTVIFPWTMQTEHGEERNMISIAKHRNGPVCKFRVNFRKEITSFEDYQEEGYGKLY